MSGVANPQGWLTESVGGGVAASGATVNVNSSLGIPAVWCGVNLISGAIAGLEIKIKRRTADGHAEELRSHPAYRLLNRAPNDWQCPYVFRQTLMGHALLQGNGRAWIRRNGIGQPVELIPLLPWDTYVAIIDGEKYHVTYIHPDYPGPGGPEGNVRTFHDDDVLHIPSFSYNGFWGIHLIQVARDALGLGISGQQATGATMKNNGRPGILLEAPQGQYRTAQKRRELLDEFNRTFKGAENTGKAMLLHDGIKAQMVAMRAADAELKELREMTNQDISRLLCLPSDSGTNAYKSITERQMLLNTNTLAPWVCKWQQEVYRKLLSERERATDEYEIDMDTSPIIKGDPNSWADYTGKLRQQGLISGNEGRIMHGMNTVDDEFLASYGNPNITTTANSAPEETDEEEPEESVDARAIRRVIAPLIAYECRRVRRAARGQGNFLSWADKWYTKFHEDLSNECKALGLPSTLAADYCDTSQGDLLEIAGTVSQSGLASAIEDLVKSWPERIEEFLADVRV